VVVPYLHMSECLRTLLNYQSAGTQPHIQSGLLSDYPEPEVRTNLESDRQPRCRPTTPERTERSTIALGAAVQAKAVSWLPGRNQSRQATATEMRLLLMKDDAQCRWTKSP